MPYEKIIEQTDTGMVVAKVLDSTGERVGLEFFHWPPFRQERRLQRAHAWADKWVRNCEMYCTPAKEKRSAKP
jgi:hypothetical protein